MFTLIVSFLLAVITVNASTIDKWSPNRWKGYQPLAEHEVADGVLHIYNARAKHGFGWKTSELYPAVAGDEVVVTATIKGSGRLSFLLHYYGTEKNRWIGIGHHCANTELSESWQRKIFHIAVGNLQGGITKNVLPSFSCGHGEELYIKDITISVNKGDHGIVGDLMFPQDWLVFGGVDREFEAPVDRIPEKLGERKGESVVLNQNMFAMRSFFEEAEKGSCAWLYAELKSPYECDYTIGAGADYFMAVYVNGVNLIDTLSTGNMDYPPHFSNYIATTRLRKGSNIVAIKFIPGKSKNPMLSLGGANELRDLSSVVTVSKYHIIDEYDTPRERMGNPEIVEDILTDGIEQKYKFGHYKSGSYITFSDQKWSFPPLSGELFFATGLRLQKITGNGTMQFKISDMSLLEIKQEGDDDELQVTLRGGESAAKSIRVSKASLPADITFAIQPNRVIVNITSLQDSKLHTLQSDCDLGDLGEFTTGVELYGCDAVVGNYFTGLARCEVKVSAVPFMVELEPTFDPVEAGWELIWQDEFDKPEVDWEKTWMNTPYNPVPRNREQAYTKDGKLHIRCDFSENPGGKRPYKGKTVGLISQERFSYGYFEARLRLTHKPGWWAAFWMQDEGRNMSVGGGYEIDILEDYTTRRTGKAVIANNLHVVFGPNMRSYGYHVDMAGTLDEFYTIGCKWTPFEVSTYINGKLARTSARHSPYSFATFDGINHGFCTSTLYICLSGQAGYSGGNATDAYSEEFVVDYVRAYKYPRARDPEISWAQTPENSIISDDELFTLSVGAKPSKESKATIKTAYLFDNGNLIAHTEEEPYSFTLALNSKYYEGTIWSGVGRSGQRALMDAYTRFFIVAVQDEEGRVAYTKPFPMIMDMRDERVAPPDEIPVVPGSIKPTNHNKGGHNIAYYKQKRGGCPTGKENLFRYHAGGLREAGEWITYSIDVKEGGNYNLILNRRAYRRDAWPIRGMVLVNGRYMGDLEADKGVETAILKGLKLETGIQEVTLISACTYGLWPESLEFVRE